MRNLLMSLMAAWARIGRDARQRVALLAGLALVAVVAALLFAVLGRFPQDGRGGLPGDRATATTRPTPTATVDPWTTQALSVQGSRIVNTRGQPVTLLGAARFSLEYACRGDGHFKLSDFQAMRAWGMNTVRLPLSSAFWRNLGGACPTYRGSVTAAVANAEQAGLYVILDLQRDAPFSTAGDAKHGGAQCPLPDARYDLAFWKDVAATYRNDPRVLFDIFGEPNTVDWSQWRNGGAIATGCHLYPTAQTYTAIGMPALAAAVRSIAPRNLIILSGVAWGYDLSGVAGATQTPNVLYATHPWDHASFQQPSDWDRAFGLTARTLPVIATEFGQYDCQTDYLATAVGYFEQRHISFLAWAWTTGRCSTPALLANWSGEPTAPYGAFIRDQILQAARSNPPGGL
ncbi:MAG TPA: cellulase family glycosylhydrolase [Ktedonobacterales bacterium]